MSPRIRFPRLRFPSFPMQKNEGAAAEFGYHPTVCQLQLLDMPFDTLVHILSMLDAKSLISFATVSRHANKIGHSNLIWMQICLQAWGLPSSVSLHQLAPGNGECDLTKLSSLYPSIVPWPSELETEAHHVRPMTLTAVAAAALQHHQQQQLAVAAAAAGGDDQEQVVVEGGPQEGEQEVVVVEEGEVVEGGQQQQEQQHRPTIAFKVFEDTHTVQYVGDGLGQGNRAVRSTTPFPTLINPEESDEWLSMWDRLARSLRIPRSSFPSSATIAAGMASSSPAAMMAAAAMMMPTMPRPPAFMFSSSPLTSPSFLSSASSPFSYSSSSSSAASMSTKPFSAPWTRPDGKLEVAPRLLGYYEVTIKPRVDDGIITHMMDEEPEAAGNNNDEDGNPGVGGGNNCVAVGLASQEFPLEGYMPGWDATSYAFHSDDGGIFHGTGIKVRYYGPPYGVGDVVGCGLDYTTREIFFTLNGKYLGVAFTDVKGTLFPTVGIDSKNPVALNFGERPFAFDMDSYQEVKASYTPPPQPPQPHHVLHPNDGGFFAAGGMLLDDDEDDDFDDF